MKNLKIISSAIAMLICLLTFGQDKKVTGVVSDDQEPLAGANVVIKGTSFGVQTDIDGNYTIKVKQGETLVFSFIGMQEKSFIVGASNMMNIKMQKSDVVLEESYGYTPDVRRKKSITNEIVDVKSIKNDTINKPSKVSCSSSFNKKSQPLYVVDGVPIKKVQSLKLDPNSIESISVLKDSSATVLYGTSGRFGVIVIKTKKGLTKKEIRLQKRQQKKSKDCATVRIKSTN